jgi:hypothetical protein
MGRKKSGEIAEICTNVFGKDKGASPWDQDPIKQSIFVAPQGRRLTAIWLMERACPGH